MPKRLFYFSLLALLALVLIGPDAPADDPAQEPPSSTETSSAEQGADPSEQSTDASELKEAAPDSETADDRESLETFVPSEKLPADSAISFPVDI